MAAQNSLIFPALAFGGVLPLIVLGQFAAKVCGGALWAWLLKPSRLAVAALLLLAAPLQGQFLSAGVGYFRNDFVSDPVAEVAIGAPQWPGFLRANVIASWTLGPWDAEPVLIPQVGMDVRRFGPVLLGGDVGLVFVPWLDYRNPHPTVSGRAFYFLPAGFKVVAIGAVQPWHDEKSLVLKLDRGLWFRR